MKVLAILSQKGGVGKTTLATCLAVAAEQAGKVAAIIDLDPQAHATLGLGCAPWAGEPWQSPPTSPDPMRSTAWWSRPWPDTG